MAQRMHQTLQACSGLAVAGTLQPWNTRTEAVQVLSLARRGGQASKTRLLSTEQEAL
jgi:hypothetical protein